ncbi:hypothetical protein KIH07_16800 [Hydrogenophaga taeniospiralis]|uniref:hypothetical protein n=1 Tax=Hydrogenophaga taeniospiralis TaxID=65656 RepID=UPI001CFA0DBB|nr:hypothetical protein [Hydrogenophaga taeniospiralis]MCB4365404.1 hypothetical protein [Hydrogenophaga taeniospiralis]
MPAPKDTAAPAASDRLPQSGGSYIRQPDGALVLQKTKVDLSALVAAKAAAADRKPTEPTSTPQE